jgi:hypothetical protein
VHPREALHVSQEFEPIFANSASWAADVVAGCADNHALASEFLLLQVQVAVHSLAAYHRRVVSVFAEFWSESLDGSD